MGIRELCLAFPDEKKLIRFDKEIEAKENLSSNKGDCLKWCRTSEGIRTFLTLDMIAEIEDAMQYVGDLPAILKRYGVKVWCER